MCNKIPNFWHLFETNKLLERSHFELSFTLLYAKVRAICLYMCIVLSFGIRSTIETNNNDSPKYIPHFSVNRCQF